MSEYQYFEFLAIDRPLTAKEMAKLRCYSTRARITTTSFINEYHWGDFKGDADKWMELYFDAFMHVACWGTRIFKLRLPASVLSPQMVAKFCAGDSFDLVHGGGRTVLTFTSEQDGGGDWEAPEGWLSTLTSLRPELAWGDLRCLYLGWLLGVQNEEVDPDSQEPAVPAGLGQLSDSLLSLVDFLRLDQDLLAVAAQASPTKITRVRDRGEIKALIKKMPAKDKDEFLTRLALGEGAAAVGAEVIRKLNAEDRPRLQLSGMQPLRCVKEIMRAAEEHRRCRLELEAKRTAEEASRRQRTEALARANYLDRIAAGAAGLWKKVDELIGVGQPKSYDQAVKLLVDLKDLDSRKGNIADFRTRVEALIAVHARKGRLLERIRTAGVG
jgi:hypothetical protein